MNQAVYVALIECGCDPQKAEAAARSLPDPTIQLAALAAAQKGVRFTRILFVLLCLLFVLQGVSLIAALSIIAALP